MSLLLRPTCLLGDVDVPIKLYPNYCDGVVVVSDFLSMEIGARYFLSARINKHHDKQIAYVLMNPSYANLEISDETINNMINFTRFKFVNVAAYADVGVVTIVNIFPIYETNSLNLAGVIQNIQSDLGEHRLVSSLRLNSWYLSRILDKAHHVVLGWGDVPKGVSKELHRDQTLGVLNLLQRNHHQSVHVFLTNKQSVLTKKHQPRHPSREHLKGIVSCTISPITLQLKPNSILV